MPGLQHRGELHRHLPPAGRRDDNLALLGSLLAGDCSACVHILAHVPEGRLGRRNQAGVAPCEHNE